MAAALDYDSEAQQLRFTQFTPWPEGQHDADLCTILRVRDFRSLAMDLRAGGPDGSESCPE